ncbi:MAG: ABC transporter permease [Desulfobacca sp.]|uniref:ABC transporter permease n=1 Tax=Desulfobacca sp. TaxID=2067990 RepID=UPI0040491E2F
MNWLPIFLREILIFKRRLLRLGYVLSSMLTPLLYLLVFGVGLGKRVVLAGESYLDFLMPGLIAYTAMINAYTWIANGITVSRLFFRNFQVYLQAPVSASAIMVGQVMAGISRGLFAALVLVGCGYLVGSRPAITILSMLTILLNCFAAASFGVIVGLLSRSHDDAATVTNFIMMPMAFFSGTFFPVDEMPRLLQPVILALPLTHVNHLLRQPAWSPALLPSLSVLAAYGLICFFLGVYFLRRYDE